MGENKRSVDFTKQLVIMGLLIALDVILTRFLSFQFLTARIGFGFLPVAICGLMFGPLSAMISGIAGDLIGFSLFPKGTYFIGFTVSAALRGLIYGYFLKNRESNTLNIALAALTNSIFITLILDTIWLNILIGKAFWVLLPTRALQAVFMFIVQVALISTVGSGLKKAKFLSK